NGWLHCGVDLHAQLPASEMQSTTKRRVCFDKHKKKFGGPEMSIWGASQSIAQSRRPRSQCLVRGTLLRFDLCICGSPTLASFAGKPDVAGNGRDAGAMVRGLARLAIHLLGNQLV